MWAASPLLRNPTNIDIDRDGRIWVAEGVRYRSHHARQPEGDRIVVLQDTDGDGKADSTHTFVQEPELIAPLGVSVIDNKIIVAQPPDLIVYTDVDRNLRFDPAVDKREVLLTGFQGINHDHSLHSVTVGPDGKWVFNSGNMGAMFTDRSGKTFRIFSAYRPGPVGPFKYPHDPGRLCRQAERRRARLRRRIHGADESGRHQRRDHRPQLPQQLRAVGHLARRRLPERQRRSAGVPRQLGDGVRQLRLLVERRPAHRGRRIAGPGQSIAGRRVAAGGSGHGAGRATSTAADRRPATCSTRTARSARRWKGSFFAADAGRNEIFSYQPARQGAGFALDRKVFVTTNVKQQYAGSDFVGGNEAAPGARSRRCSGRPISPSVPTARSTSATGSTQRVGGHQDLDDTSRERSTASRRRGSCRGCRRSTRRRSTG